MSTRRTLIRLLADGSFRSGEELARELNLSRSAVWKSMKRLEDMGMDVHAVAGRGYRFAAPFELLDRERILAAAGTTVGGAVAKLEVHEEIDSTNTYLMAQKPPAAGEALACLAEFQTKARGRKGRSWLAPYGSGVCLSVGWTFDEQPPDFSALALALGVAIVRALGGLGISGVQLKWPNDVIWNRHKLAGILTEMRGESPGPAYVVAGIGLNVRLPRDAVLDDRAALPAVDLARVCQAGTPDRNELAGAIIREVIAALQQFAETGFASFREDWQAADGLAEAPVRLSRGREVSIGTARGIDRHGALLFESRGEIRSIISGELSLRPE